MTALVTGASSGIGLQYAVILARDYSCNLLMVSNQEKELEAAVDAFVSGLSETERRIFIARYWFLLSVKEIADRLGCTQSKVKTSLFRTRNKLRLYLQEEELC